MRTAEETEKLPFDPIKINSIILEGKIFELPFVMVGKVNIFWRCLNTFSDKLLSTLENPCPLQTVPVNFY